MRKSGIYIIQNLKTGQFYIGSTRNLSHRKNCHFSELRKGEHDNSRLQKSFDQCGEKFFTFSILEYVENTDELSTREQHWIDQLNPEYNIRLGAVNHPNTITDALLRKYKKHSEILTGRKQSQETKDKRANSIREFWATHPAKTVPDEMRKHLSKINTGKKNPNWGKKRSTESRKRTSDSVSKIKVRLLSPDGIEYYVEKLGQFCREQELDYFQIRRVAIGTRKFYKGWTKVPADAGENSSS